MNWCVGGPADAATIVGFVRLFTAVGWVRFLVIIIVVIVVPVSASDGGERLQSR